MPSTSVTEVQSFIGFVGYYWCFIKDFSKIAKPMTKLLEKNKDYKWTPECQARRVKATTHINANANPISREQGI
jgi:hypothetical protein